MLRNAESTRTNALVLDLSQVSTVDAGGLGVLLELREQVQSVGMGFKLTNVNRLIGMVLKITRLDTVFEVTSGVEFFPAISQRSASSRVEFASCA
jgi:anti-anti-sigma factor